MDIKREPPKKTKRYIMFGVGVVGIVAISAWVMRLGPASQTVERSTLVIDSVRHGDIERTINASGTLKPEHVVIVASLTSGRVDELPVHPGETVTPTTTIIQLSNPDEDLAVLNDDQALSQQLSSQAILKDQLKEQQMSEEASIASLRTTYNAAVRLLAVDDSLVGQHLVAANDAAGVRDQVTELKARMDIENRRLQQMQAAGVEELKLSGDEVAHTQAILDAQKHRVESMRVTAGEPGVLQSLNNLERGQWVQAGTELARVAQPDRLKAVLQVPDNQAKEIAVGQHVVIDLHNNSTAEGHVVRADPAVQAGTVTVDVALDGQMPEGLRADQSVDGTIEIEKMKNILYVGRPIYGQPNATVGLFRLSPDGNEASRVQVKFGRASVSYIEVLGGLNLNDKIIVSDMAAYDADQHIRLK